MSLNTTDGAELAPVLDLTALNINKTGLKVAERTSRIRGGRTGVAIGRSASAQNPHQGSDAVTEPLLC